MVHGVYIPLVQAYNENKSSYECHSQHVHLQLREPRETVVCEGMLLQLHMKACYHIYRKGAFRFHTMHGNLSM
jgi:hypothetical protein